MTDLKKQLLLGCGYPLRGGSPLDGTSYRKKMRVFGTSDRWERLTTLDINPLVDPDLWCDLSETHWAAKERGSDQFCELKSDFWDEIHAYEVLEHLGQQGDAFSFFAHFSEIYRLLKPGGHLCATVPSKRSCDQARRYDNGYLCEHGSEPQAFERDPEDRHRSALDERSQRRIRNVSPVKMQRIREKLQLISMETITHVGKQMEHKNAGGYDRNREQGARVLATLHSSRHRIVRGIRLQHTL